MIHCSILNCAHQAYRLKLPQTIITFIQLLTMTKTGYVGGGRIVHVTASYPTVKMFPAGAVPLSRASSTVSQLNSEYATVEVI